MEVRRESLDDWGWASLGKPWEELGRDDVLMGVFEKAVGRAARVEALVAGRRCLAALKYSWDEGMWIVCPDAADSAGARSWVQGDARS